MDKKIIILGGLGFMGKNLYKGLKDKGYDVTIFTDIIYEENDDFLNPDTRKDIIIGTILDRDFIGNLLKDYDIIFSFAGNSGASGSIKEPYNDLDTNLKGHLNILEACRMHNRGKLLIFPSSRLVYGKPIHYPVNEKHRLNPVSIYAIHKLATEYYYLLYHKVYNVNCLIFRISNPFGPYQHFGKKTYGILNWFIYKAIRDKKIMLYGKGSQKRDFLYIDDLIGLFIDVIGRTDLYGKIYNIGYGEGISLRESAEIIREYLPGTEIQYVPWPEIDKVIETGDYISDIRLIKKESGWSPEIDFREGIRKTIHFYETYYL